jgi:hypothetical protein
MSSLMAAKSTRQRTWLTRERVALAGLLAFTVLVRGGVLLAMREKLRDDPDAYRRIAENLLAHGTFSMDDFDGGRVTTDLDGRPSRATPTAYRPPLYPVVLSNLAAADGASVSPVKVGALHLLLGVATVWLTWLLARRLQIGNCKLQIANWGDGGSAPAAGLTHPTRAWWAEPTLRMPLVAGVMVACDPILLNQSALVMTETLAAFLAVLALWCLARFDGRPSWFNAGLAGGAMGLAVLCRPSFLPWIALVGAGMLLVRGRNSECRMQNAELGANAESGTRSAERGARPARWWSDVGWRVVNCAALVGVAAMVVSPWVIRNQRVFGKPIVTTTHGGYTLYLGNNPEFFAYLEHSEDALPWAPSDKLFAFHPYAVPPSRHVELGEDQLLYAGAREAIREQPATFVRACLYRVGQLWSPLPNRLTAEESTGRRLLRYAVAGWYCGVYLLAAVGVWRIWKSGPPLRGRPGGREEEAARERATDGESAGGAVLPRSGGPLLRARWVWGVLLCLVFTGVHTFYWSNLRMRAPLMPFVACVAGAAFLTGPKRS